MKAAVKGLKAGETYRYRLVAGTEATNNGGTKRSEESCVHRAAALP